MKKHITTILLNIIIAAVFLPYVPAQDRLPVPSSKSMSPGSVYFDPFIPSNIMHKKVWEVDRNYGQFFMEFDAKPKTPNHLGYAVSDGAGGQHAVLIGASSGTDKFVITGNIFDGNYIISIDPSIRLNLNQWYRFGIGYNGQFLLVWVNGKLIHRQSFNGVRKTLAGGSDGNLYIGGSFHNKFGGNIARARLIEGSCPYPTDYIPDKVFDKYIKISDGNYVKASFVADYTSASEFFADFGTGIDGDRHDGTFTGYTPETAFPVFQNDRVNYASNASYTQQPVPQNALTFEGFNEPDKTLISDSNLTLGHTDGGTLGQLPWLAPFGWGIIGEYGFCQYNQYYNNPIEFSRANIDLRVSRMSNPGSSTGLLLRYSDDGNLVMVTGGGGSPLVGVTYFQNGEPSYFQFSTSLNWLTLRAVANGNNLTVYTDNTQIGTVAIPSGLNGTKHGLRYAGDISVYKNFAAFPVNK